MGRESEQAFFQRRHIDGQQAHEKMPNSTNHQGNANQNHRSSKRQEIIGVDEDVEKREPSCTAGGNVNWCNHYGKQYGSSS